ncbi:MAG TPA: GGDEF domain-containing protein [Candidatus Krumholzibacteria bacterium]|nr:GGDEF domain-containing protein [Candidatus Krumholzibacteria bacterium]HRX52068.1 GGDEF domain-containing protein [Candidatus Krumholzibacteria bacterium]
MESKHDSAPPVVVQPDLELLGRVMALRRLFYLAASVIAGAVLLAWLFPFVRAVMPPRWWTLQPDTAVAVLLLVLAKSQTSVRLREAVRLTGRASAIVVLVLCLDAFLAYAGRPVLGLAHWFAVQPDGLPVMGMCPQGAIFLGLYSLSVLVEGPGAKRRRRVLDSLATLLILAFLVYVGGYVFQASGLLGIGLGAMVSPYTLICMGLLLFGLLVRRTLDGYYSVFVGIDVGSRVARLAMPFAVLIPFSIVGLGEWIGGHAWLSDEYVLALVSSVTATMLCLVVMLLARKINRLQMELVQLTLLDELTHLHNRRGFFTLGEHMLFEARRNEKSLTVLFFDLDDLKKVNDSLGHQTGSQMLADFADLLQDTFRSNDVTARLGGDEFAVAILESDPRIPMKRLGLAVVEFNRAAGRPYKISYSVGDAATDAPPGPETFTELVARADAIMYERKKRKKELKAAQATA